MGNRQSAAEAAPEAGASAQPHETDKLVTRRDDSGEDEGDTFRDFETFSKTLGRSIDFVPEETYRTAPSDGVVYTFREDVSWMNAFISQRNSWGTFLGYWQIFDVLKTLVYLVVETERGWDRNEMAPLYHTEALMSLFHTVAFNYALLYLLHDRDVFWHLFGFEVFLLVVLAGSLIVFPYTGMFKVTVMGYQVLSLFIVVPDMAFSYGVGTGLLSVTSKLNGEDTNVVMTAPVVLAGQATVDAFKALGRGVSGQVVNPDEDEPASAAMFRRAQSMRNPPRKKHTSDDLHHAAAASGPVDDLELGRRKVSMDGKPPRVTFTSKPPTSSPARIVSTPPVSLRDTEAMQNAADQLEAQVAAAIAQEQRLKEQLAAAVAQEERLKQARLEMEAAKNNSQ